MKLQKILKQFFHRVVSLLAVSFFSLCYKPLLSARQNQKVWLIGENRGKLVQDNGYYFFQYCRQAHPDKQIFLIAQESTIAKMTSLKPDNNIVIYGSLKHFYLFSIATLCFYTHDFRDVIYRRIFQLFGTKKIMIFLHHGVLGLKRFSAFYQKNKNIMHLFTVAFQHERNILINEIGVLPEKIKTTGYARFDYLQNRASSTPLQIIYLPTFRDWDDNVAGKSQLYSALQSLLNNKDLLQILEQYNIEFKVLLHVEMEKGANLLQSSSEKIRILKYGEISVHDLLESGSLMISDYSSVSWDFFFLRKPVIYYRFDCDKFNQERGSYLDLKQEIIGDIVFNEQNLIQVLGRYAKDGFKIQNHFEKKWQAFFNLPEKGACENIYRYVERLDC